VENAFLTTIASWGILPVWKKVITDRAAKTLTWARQAEVHFNKTSPNPGQRSPVPSGKVLVRLASDYYDTIKGSKRGVTAFLKATEQSLKKVACSCTGSHTCSIRNCWGTPASLAELFQREFALQVDGTADALHRTQLPQWFSAYESDAEFGGRFDILSQELRGLNLLINPPFSQQRKDQQTGQSDHIMIRIIDRLCATKNSELPTRAVMIIPNLPGPGGDRFRQYAREKKLIEFLHFPPGSFHFQAPQSFMYEEPYFPGGYQRSVSVFLFMNNRSLLYDPIDWQETKKVLSAWLAQHCPTGEIVPEADKKFGERAMSKAPTRLPRNVQETCPLLTLMSPSPTRQCQRSLKKQVGKRLRIVNSINNGNRQAATVGLFPHALREMVKEKYPADFNVKMDHLSRTVIRACAARFREYQRLTVLYESFRTMQGRPNVHNCLDPFHYLDVL
jgi:hypothetical protein